MTHLEGTKLMAALTNTHRAHIQTNLNKFSCIMDPRQVDQGEKFLGIMLIDHGYYQPVCVEGKYNGL